LLTRASGEKKKKEGNNCYRCNISDPRERGGNTTGNEVPAFAACLKREKKKKKTGAQRVKEDFHASRSEGKKKNRKVTGEGGRVTGEIGAGLMILLGVGQKKTSMAKSSRTAHMEKG